MNSDTATLFRSNSTLFLVPLSIIATATVFLATSNYGAGLSPDSVGYIAAARQMATGIGAVLSTPLPDQPPLYPALLAAFDYVFGIDPLSSAHIVNAVLFGLIVYLSQLLSLRLLKSSLAFALLGGASLLVCPPLVGVSLMAWSEPLFICFLLFYLILSGSYLAKAAVASLLLLSLSVALACLTRYIGVILILTGIVSIVAFSRTRPRIRIGHVVLFLLISALPIGLWVIRNYLLYGTFLGSRASSIFTFQENLGFAHSTVLSWYVPNSIAGHRSLLMLLSATIGFLAGRSATNNWSKIRTRLSDLRLLLLVIIAYVGFLVVSSTIVAYDRIDDRLLSPVAVPITLLVLFFVYTILTSAAEQCRSQRRANLFLAFGVAMWLLYPTIETTRRIGDAVINGQGYSGKSWRTSQTIEYLRRNHTLASECVIYSNAPDALYILANMSAQYPPSKTRYNSPERVNDISSLRGTWPGEASACLVWFDRYNVGYLFSIDELQTIASMRRVVGFDDGGVYYVTRK